jgi:hypothetical protein
MLWRSKLQMQDAVFSLKEVSRPLRHKIGLQRASVPT